MGCGQIANFKKWQSSQPVESADGTATPILLNRKNFTILKRVSWYETMKFKVKEIYSNS